VTDQPILNAEEVTFIRQAAADGVVHYPDCVDLADSHEALRAARTATEMERERLLEGWTCADEEFERFLEDVLDLIPEWDEDGTPEAILRAVAGVVTERDELRAEVARHHADFEQWEQMAANGHARAERSEAEVAGLREALTKYGRHTMTPDMRVCPAEWRSGATLHGPCECGLDAVLAGMRVSPTPEPEATMPTQAQVLAWAAERWPDRTTPVWRAAKLCEEAGEVMGAVIKVGEGRKTNADVAQETAQAVICCMGVAESVGFDVWAEVAAEWARIGVPAASEPDRCPTCDNKAVIGLACAISATGPDPWHGAGTEDGAGQPASEAADVIRDTGV
jgi:NTP pyrophosphatase (non-canonical NTP hydrolase)